MQMLFLKLPDDRTTVEFVAMEAVEGKCRPEGSFLRKTLRRCGEELDTDVGEPRRRSIISMNCTSPGSQRTCPDTYSGFPSVSMLQLRKLAALPLSRRNSPLVTRLASQSAPHCSKISREQKARRMLIISCELPRNQMF